MRLARQLEQGILPRHDEQQCLPAAQIPIERRAGQREVKQVVAGADGIPVAVCSLVHQAESDPSARHRPAQMQGTGDALTANGCPRAGDEIQITARHAVFELHDLEAAMIQKTRRQILHGGSANLARDKIAIAHLRREGGLFVIHEGPASRKPAKHAMQNSQKIR